MKTNTLAIATLSENQSDAQAPVSPELIQLMTIDELSMVGGGQDIPVL